MQNSFKIDVSDLFPKRLDEVKATVEGASRPLSEIGLMDLVLVNPEAQAADAKPLLYGVYLFFDDDGQCAYVGETTVAFVKRIGQHLNPNFHDGWNQFLRYSHENLEGAPGLHYHQTAAQVAEHQLTIIYFDPHDWEEPMCKAGGDPRSINEADGWRGAQLAEPLEITFQAVYCDEHDAMPLEGQRSKPAKWRRLGARKEMVKDGGTFSRQIMAAKQYLP